MTLEAVKPKILENSSFLIIPHEDPDGDTLGSALGLAWALKALKKEVRIFLPKPPSPMYRWMTELYGDFVVDSSDHLGAYQAIIVVDCGSLQLIKASAPFLGTAEVINIDHHADNARFGAVNWIDPEYAATTMMIFDLVQALEVPLGIEIATALYTGLVTDTGSFAFSNTDTEVFQMATKCTQAGIVPYAIYNKIFESRPLSSLKLLGIALSRIETSPKGSIGWIAVSREMLLEAGALPSETDGLINHLRTIDSVKVALVFRENENGKIKASLRSKSSADANRIAKPFGGGGHPKAAGCTLELPLEEAVQQVVSATEKELERCGEDS